MFHLTNLFKDTGIKTGLVFNPRDVKVTVRGRRRHQSPHRRHTCPGKGVRRTQSASRTYPFVDPALDSPPRIDFFQLRLYFSVKFHFIQLPCGVLNVIRMLRFIVCVSGEGRQHNANFHCLAFSSHPPGEGTPPSALYLDKE